VCLIFVPIKNCHSQQVLTNGSDSRINGIGREKCNFWTSSIDSPKVGRQHVVTWDRETVLMWRRIFVLAYVGDR